MVESTDKKQAAQAAATAENTAANQESSDNEETEIQGADFFKNRFYRTRVPEKDMVTMVEISEITDMGANVRLLEYGGIEGFI